MKITRAGQTVIDTESLKNHLRLKHLEQGDVFRFVAGNEKNLYIKTRTGYQQLHTGTEYDECRYGMRSNVAVIFYPDAHLELGREQNQILPEEVK